MNILILGDVVGNSGRKHNKNLQEICAFKIDFTIVNGENAVDDGKELLKISINYLN